MYHVTITMGDCVSTYVVTQVNSSRQIQELDQYAILIHTTATYTFTCARRNPSLPFLAYAYTLPFCYVTSKLLLLMSC